MTGRLVQRGIWWGWLLACLVSLLALIGAVAALGHETWASVVRLVCAALLLPLGLLVVRNWLHARDIVVARLVQTEGRSRHVARMHRHLISLVLVVLAIAWIAVGTFNLVRALDDLL
jgi:hypothetical protein